MTTRKRRRQEAFEEQPEYEPDPIQTEEEAATARVEKEQEIWDSIRETHYEAIEQLPLTLHRQLSLMRQLDEQTSSCGARILPTVQKYIELRRRVAGKMPTKDQVIVQSGTSEPTQSPHSNSVMTPVRTGEPPIPAGNALQSSEKTGKSKSETSGDMIRQTAFMGEELLRASQEKVNLAQANCDSVERHIQLLDQAIKEQEATLSSDANSRTHIHLPELVIPERRQKTSQKPRDTDVDQEQDELNVIEGVDDSIPTNKSYSKRKGKDERKGKRGHDSSALIITLPGAQSNDEPEPLYCYCSRVSFGEMIACDNSSCEREWFHYGCVGLLEPPEGEWFCEDCKSRMDDA